MPRTDDLAMALVERALRRPEQERESYLRRLCGDNGNLFEEAWTYVQWERRMQGFLLDPLYGLLCRDAPFAAGQTLINRFHLVREVAQGGMGVVWEAIDQKLDRRVAIKCAKEGFGKQLPPEVRNAREISHPNVCKIYEIHTASLPDGEIDFISMEFVEGETLADRIRREPLAETEARAIARQLCAGLAEAHRNAVIHGDLKTNNVLLSKDADGSVRAVITDFGLARRADAATGLVGGTRPYMAPELWKGEKPSVASDIYALGVMLWELRSGKEAGERGADLSTLPLDKPASPAAKRCLVHTGEQSPSLRAGVAGRLRRSWRPSARNDKWGRIIARCVDPDPARRFQSVAEIEAAFGPSHLSLWLLGTAAALVLVAGSGALTYQRVTAPQETVRLALLPFAANTDKAAVSERLLRETANQLSALKSSAHTRFRFISLDKVIRNRVHTAEESRVLLGADHALQATVGERGDRVTVHAYFEDLRSGVELREWTAEYKPAEVKYAPTGLAALVTRTLHLPSPVAGSKVNAAAAKDYAAGLQALRRDRTIDEALERFGRAAKADPDSALPWAGLAEAQWFKFVVTTDKLWSARAGEAVRQAQLRNPDLAPVHRIAGLLESREGRYESAVAAYLRAIELDPGNGDAYRRLGEAHEHTGQLEEALASFQKAIEADPRQYRNYRDLGDLYLQEARYDDAISQFRKALDLEPNEPLVQYHLAMAHQNKGQFSLAEHDVRASLAAAERPSALYKLGLLLMYEGKDDQAIPYFVRALRPGQEIALGWLNLGIAYRRVGSSAAASEADENGLKLAEAELENNPRDALTRSYLGYLCAQKNEGARAKSELSQALKESPRDADVIFVAASTYEALGSRDSSLKVLSTAPLSVLEDIYRWPDLAGLSKDPRFLQLLALQKR